MSEESLVVQNISLSCDIFNILVNLHFQHTSSTCLITTTTHVKFRKVAKNIYLPFTKIQLPLTFWYISLNISLISRFHLLFFFFLYFYNFVLHIILQSHLIGVSVSNLLPSKIFEKHCLNLPVQNFQCFHTGFVGKKTQKTQKTPQNKFSLAFKNFLNLTL